MPLPVLEREIGGMLQLTLRFAPGAFQPERRGSRSQHKPGKRNALIVRDLDFTAADIDLSCRAANLQGNARLRHHDIGLSSISSGAVSPASTDDSSTRVVCEPRLIADHRDGMATERASGQFVDQSRRGHSVTDDDQRLAHGISLLGA